MFVNPYNFVRLEPMADGLRQTPVSHHHPTRRYHSGRLTCRIVALGPIFVKPEENARDRLTFETVSVGSKKHSIYKKFFNFDGFTPVIPASTLKGGFRATSEALVNSCLSSYNLNLNLPEGLGACQQLNDLCITCRLFGMAPQDEGNKELHRGKVLFSDAIYKCEMKNKEPEYSQYVILDELSSPKPGKCDFYTSNGSLKGRKFYYHHDGLIPKGECFEDYAALKAEWNIRKNLRNAEDKGWDRKSTVHPLRRGVIFEFQVDYDQLSDAELQLLIMGLELEPFLTRSPDDEVFFVPDCGDDFFIKPGVYHKMGYGKPAGLGSAAVIIVDWKQLDLGERYSDGPGSGIVDVSSLRDEIKKLKQAFKNTYQNKTFYQDLTQILRYPNGIAEIRYPEFRQFDQYTLPEPGNE